MEMDITRADEKSHPPTSNSGDCRKEACSIHYAFKGCWHHHWCRMPPAPMAAFVVPSPARHVVRPCSVLRRYACRPRWIGSICIRHHTRCFARTGCSRFANEVVRPLAILDDWVPIASRTGDRLRPRPLAARESEQLRCRTHSAVGRVGTDSSMKLNSFCTFWEARRLFG